MILDDVRAFLISQSAVPTGWAIYEGYIPDETDTVIALYETGGLPAQELQRENERITFQTRVRTTRLDYDTGRVIWKAIYDTLQDSNLGDPDTYFLVQSQHAGPMAFNDDKGRPNFVTNWRVIQKRS